MGEVDFDSMSLDELRLYTSKMELEEHETELKELRRLLQEAEESYADHGFGQRNIAVYTKDIGKEQYQIRKLKGKISDLQSN